MKKHTKRHGRHLLTLGAAALLGLSGYELWIRLEDFWTWTKGIRHLSEVRGTPFLEDMAIIFEEPEMRALGFKLLFLLGAIAFAIICLIRRNRAKGGWTLIVLDLGLAASGAALELYSLRPGDWAQVLKLAPLVLILIGTIVNMVDRQVRRKRKKRRKEAERERVRPSPGPRP